MTEDEKAILLAQERDKTQAKLEEIRALRMQLNLKNRDDRRDLLMKLGELSFIVGAAVTPILIVSDSNISHKSFAVLGVAIYLTSGLLAMWRCKTLLYQDAEDSPKVGLDEEIQLQPIVHSYNKLISNPSSAEYAQEYKNASEQAIRSLTTSSDGTAKSRIDPTIDLVLYGFILATLLILRTQWPFNDVSYWISLALFGVIAIVLSLRGYYEAKLVRQSLEHKRSKVAEIRNNYQEWHDKEMFGG